MAGDVAAGIPAVDMPTWAGVAAILKVGRVEPEPCDGREGVAWAGINCNPTAAAAFAKAQKFPRRDWGCERAGMMQRERHGAGAIVAAIVERPMAAAPDIWLTA